MNKGTKVAAHTICRCDEQFSPCNIGSRRSAAEYCVPTWITDFINVINVFGKVWILQLGRPGGSSGPPAAGEEERGGGRGEGEGGEG